MLYSTTVVDFLMMAGQRRSTNSGRCVETILPLLETHS